VAVDPVDLDFADAVSGAFAESKVQSEKTFSGSSTTFENLLRR